MKIHTALLASFAVVSAGAFAQAQTPSGVANIDTVVVIYAENRSFDNLYGAFPGANGLQNVTPENSMQLDRDGTELKELPPVWGGLTAKGVTPAVTQAQTEHMPAKPFAIDDPNGLQYPARRHHPRSLASVLPEPDADRRRQERQVRRLCRFRRTWLWVTTMAPSCRCGRSRQEFVLADNFFQGAFGGSFLNHFELICACIPVYPDADKSPAKGIIAAVEADGVSLKLADNSPKSAMDGVPKFVNNGQISPDFYAVNTMQPPYQPSNNPPPPEGDPRLADPSKPNTLPPQHDVTIGDLLSAKGVSWAWYAGAWQATLDGPRGKPVPNFQFHHQPFNFFVQFAPGTEARAMHLKDGGMNGVEFIKAVDAGVLPQVTFYKPQGNLNEHPGYTDAMSGDQHIAEVIAHLQKSPQWAHMLVLVTYDENGGFWDHVAPPKADRWGPGSRIPAFIISPFARKGTVDHTQYDTTSVLRFITRRFDLPVLPGLAERDAALKANGQPAMGDLTAALTF